MFEMCKEEEKREKITHDDEENKSIIDVAEQH